MNENDSTHNLTYDDYKEKKSKNKKSNKKGLIIFAIIVVAIIVLGVSCNNVMKTLIYGDGEATKIDYSQDYIAVISVEGTISDASDSLIESQTYNHNYTMNAIDQIIADEDNKALVLQINSPGGSVFTSDELYLKLLEYKETGRPIYSAMGSMAASGGYYIAAPSDRIIANRNCWTGSIGVKIGTLYDFTELIETLGIKAETITSGENKNMGDSFEEMTEDQRKIFQSLVDEAYEQFVKIVATGRGLTIDEVKTLGDGRIFTATQALENGLIDEIGDYDYAIDSLMENESLERCDVIYLYPEEENDIFSLLTGSLNNNAESEYKELIEMVSNSDKFTVTYMSNVIK
ncbi:MAG TPA: signal peptide peptidase SppA [Anaerovoracaceae bacterium]|nr:signal peptide peptidase SppA [Anaerovoracaceae bacterium]